MLAGGREGGREGEREGRRERGIERREQYTHAPQSWYHRTSSVTCKGRTSMLLADRDD